MSSRPKARLDLTDAESTQLRTAYALFDVDKNGRVPASALKRSLLEASKETDDDASVYRIIMDLDALGDAPVTFEQFCTVFAAGSAAVLRGGEISNNEAQRLFRLIDRDNNGRIGFRDLKKLVDELNEPINAQEIEEMIHRADADGDGFVDLNDFVRIITARRDPGTHRT